MTLFHTIGHSTRPIEEFVGLLHGAGVRLVCDVRSIPRSRTNPQYGQEVLPGELAACQIGYAHLPRLGGRRWHKRGAPPSPNGYWRVAGFRNYADYALTPDFGAGLAELERLGAQTPCAIMCAEAVWWRCHRRVIADYLLLRGHEVRHILGPGHIEAATLTPGAAPQPDGTILYPPSGPGREFGRQCRQRKGAFMTELQSFDSPAGPNQSAARVAALRALMAERGLDAVIVPRADAHQGEYVADCDARLRWLTGFSGSAGFAIVTADRAGVFIDGRYRVQVRAETDPAVMTPVNWPETHAADWLREALPDGGVVGFDPWLHTASEIEAIEKRLEGSGITLRAVENPVDAVWPDRPAAPKGAARIHDAAHAGATPVERRAAIAAALREAGQGTAVLTMPDSIAWLLNIRGADIPRNPIVQAFAAIDDTGAVQLFADPEKFSAEVRAHLGNAVTISPQDDFAAALAGLRGPVRVDAETAPLVVMMALADAGVKVVRDRDPVALPKARKTPAELAGMRAAHIRDAVPMIRVLAWIDAQTPGAFTEIDVVRVLERFRREAGATDISFDTICGSGPHGAMNHYRVTEATNRIVGDGELLLVDSGAQFPDGTTDVTRTVPIGRVLEAARDPYTRVLQGMIGLTRLRFPRGLAGRDIEAVARAPLWQAGLDFDHGTGHGVGAALCVHEGPLRIARRSELPIEPGMIFSNEPGYYRDGEWGIRIENLVAVEPADSPDGRDMLGFETLTLVPIDRRLIEPGMLSRAEIAWLDAYHARVAAEIGPLVPADLRDWLIAATAPLGAAV